MMTKQVEESFLDFFKGLEDPRSRRNRLYTMSEILLIFNYRTRSDLSLT